LITSGLGISDSTDEEITAILDAVPTWPPSYLLADMISRRSQIGWSTHGHSAVDVNIYASHPSHAPGLVGNHENTEVGEFITNYLDLDLEVITKELKSKKVKTQDDSSEQWGDDWMGPEGLPVNGDGSLVALDAYHGDFKHRKREVEECGCGLRHWPRAGQ
jgi:alkaline phosphatase